MRLPDSERSRAVLIGTSTYAVDSGFATVPQVAENLAQFARLLRNSTGLTHIEVLADPRGSDDFAAALEPAVEAAEDLLLFYYAGHGVTVGRDGTELALTHSTSSVRRAGYSTLPYSVVHDDIRASRAAVKVVILDCCHSGKAFGTGVLAGNDENEALGSLAEIEGAYVLTAATKFAAVQGPAGCTAFTGTMLGILREGDPGSGEYLTFSRLFPLLDSALRRNRFPRPRATGRNTAAELALARNAVWTPPTRPSEMRPEQAPSITAQPNDAQAQRTPPTAAQPDQSPVSQARLSHAGESTARSKRPRTKPAPPQKNPQQVSGRARRATPPSITLDPRWIRTIKLPDPVLALCFAPDSKRLGVSCRGSSAYIVDMLGQQRLRVQHGHRMAFRTNLILDRYTETDSQFTGWDIDFAPHDDRFVTAVGHGPAMLWTATTGDLLQRIDTGGPVRGVRISPDGQTIALLCNGRVWLHANGSLDLLGTGDDVARCAFSPDGTRLAITRPISKKIEIWHVAERRLLNSITADRPYWIDWEPRGDRLATIAMGGHIQLWDIPTATSPQQFFHVDPYSRLNPLANPPQAHVEFLTFNPDGRLLATAARDNTIRVWDPATRTCLHLIKREGIATSAAFSPNGRLLAVGSRDKTIQLWELRPSKPPPP